LRNEKDIGNQANIIYVFEVMHGCCYDLKNEKEVVADLTELATNTKDQDLKARSEEAIRFIVYNQLPDPIKLLDRTKETSRE
jgi:hypothetical protein